MVIDATITCYAFLSYCAGVQVVTCIFLFALMKNKASTEMVSICTHMFQAKLADDVVNEMENLNISH